MDHLEEHLVKVVLPARKKLCFVRRKKSFGKELNCDRYEYLSIMLYLVLRSSMVLASIWADSLLEPSGKNIFFPEVLPNSPIMLLRSS